MADNPQKEEYGGLGPDDPSFRFPGVDPDDLTDEVRAFDFDEGYLGEDRPSTADPAEAVYAAFRRETARAGGAEKPAEPAEGKEDAVFAAFHRLTRRKDPPETPSAEPSEKEEPSAEPEPAETLPPARKNRRRRREKMEYLVRPDPVTIGNNLRSDQMLVYDSELDEVDYTDDEDLPEIRDYLPIRFGRYGRSGIGGGILYALFVISVSVILACMGWMFAADVLALNKEPQSAIVFIEEYVPEEGEPLTTTVNDQELEIQVDIDQVASALKSAGIIEYKWLFKIYSQFSHAETKIDPGTYTVSTELDYRAIVQALRFGSDSQEITRVTFPEGFSTEQIFTLLEENHICKKKDLYEAAANYEFEYEFLDGLELGDPNRLEGYLFPDTYEFYQGEDATVAINRFLKNFDSKLTSSMRSRASERGYSLHEIITVASLIEKESGSVEESPTIASVIYNRLYSGWTLGLDSTINYILGTSTFDLTYDDLAIDDPYNTYLYAGLPPGPICNPGMSSIEAALWPDSTDYWYWYAVDGETTFFTNSSDFNAFAEAHPY